VKIAIQGTNRFDNYQIFLRAIRTGLQDIDKEDREIIIYSVGPRRVHQMVRDFVNISERSLRGRGIKIKMIKMPPQWVEQNIFDIDYLIFLSKPKEPYTQLVNFAESKDIEVGVYRF
jgi:hypothetical protein